MPAIDGGHEGAHRSAVHWIRGLPGSGRTRFLDDFATAWDGPVHRFAPTDFDRSTPDAAVVALLGALTAGPAEPTEAITSTTTARVARGDALAAAFAVLVAAGGCAVLDDLDRIHRHSYELVTWALARTARQIDGPGCIVAAAGVEAPAPDGAIEVHEVAELGPLDAERTVVAVRSGIPPIDPDVVGRIVHQAAGNPGALVEWAGGPTLVDALGDLAPGPATAERFHRVLEALPTEERALLATIHLLEGCAPEVVVAVGRRLLELPDGDGSGAALVRLLPRSTERGLVQVTEDRVELRHRLLGVVAAHDLDARARGRLDQLLADGHPDPGRAARHRLALGPSTGNEAAAIELERAADDPRAADRAELLTLAARAGDPGLRDERRLAAASEWAAVGRLDRAGDLAAGPNPQDRLFRQTSMSSPQRGLALLLELLRGGDGTAPADAETFAPALLDEDPTLAVALAATASCASALRGEPTGSDGPLGEILTDPGLAAHHPDARWWAAGARTVGASLAGRFDDARSHAEETREIASTPHGLGIAFSTRTVVPALVRAEAWASADALLASLRASLGPDHAQRAIVVVAAAELAYRRGDFVAAHTEAAEALASRHVHTERSVSNRAHLVLAIVAAHRGDRPGCEASLAACSARPGSATHTAVVATAGFLALQTGAPGDAVAVLGPLLDRYGTTDPAGMAWLTDLAEAHLRNGDAPQARAIIDAAEPLATAAGRQRLAIPLARMRGMLEDDFDEHFARSVALAEEMGLRHAVARTELAWGERLRRARRRAEAAQHLRAAADYFRAHDLHPSLVRAEEELRLLAPRGGSGGGAGVLSDREARIVELVRRGLSNREIATHLFVSQRTVESHLTAIYRKRGIRSRAGLFAEVGGPDTGSGGGITAR